MFKVNLQKNNIGPFLNLLKVTMRTLLIAACPRSRRFTPRRTHVGPGSSEHLLHRLHPGQPRQEVQPDRAADHGEAEIRHLSLPRPSHLPLSRRRRVHGRDPDDARLLQIDRIPVPGTRKSAHVLS
jgi:hypothetical protein